MSDVLELDLSRLLGGGQSPCVENDRTPETFASSPPAPTPDDVCLLASRRIILRCGKSSLTLYADGRIVLRGQDILSEAEGFNRVVGGHVELN
jgi:hypothetical protein